jgi:hypothetical protein
LRGQGAGRSWRLPLCPIAFTSRKPAGRGSGDTRLNSRRSSSLDRVSLLGPGEGINHRDDFRLCRRPRSYRKRLLLRPGGETEPRDELGNEGAGGFLPIPLVSVSADRECPRYLDTRPSPFPSNRSPGQLCKLLYKGFAVPGDQLLTSSQVAHRFGALLIGVCRMHANRGESQLGGWPSANYPLVARFRSESSHPVDIPRARLITSPWSAMEPI